MANRREGTILTIVQSISFKTLKFELKCIHLYSLKTIRYVGLCMLGIHVRSELHMEAKLDIYMTGYPPPPPLSLLYPFTLQIYVTVTTIFEHVDQ